MYAVSVLNFISIEKFGILLRKFSYLLLGKEIFCSFTFANCLM